MVNTLRFFVSAFVAHLLFAIFGAALFLVVPGLFHLFVYPFDTSVFFATGGCGGSLGAFACLIGAVQSDDPMLCRGRRPIALAGFAALVVVILVMIRGLTMVP